MPLMCDVADVITTLILLADVICHWWLMEWPLMCDVTGVITTWQM